MPGKKWADSPPVRHDFDLRDVTAVDDERGTFSGYLACYSLDSQGDIIEHGAFSKTLSDLKGRQQKRQGTPGGRYLFPILWGHDPDKPIGGFVDAYEDDYGLYVKGQLDLNTELGRTAYSAVTRGYVPAMSIGYFVIRGQYDRDGNRRLKEIALFEGSVVSVPANPDAVILEVKSATGKATWPLGDRTAAWDNGAAHKRIVAWATDSDGNVDTGKLKSVHFYSPDGDAAENISEYKLLFCDEVDGAIKAMPKGIFACAGSHGVDNTTGISADEKDAIRGKISAYYKRMAKEFDDDSIVAPWDKTDDGGKGKRMTTANAPTRRQPGQGQQPQGQHTPHTKARDFDTLFQSLSASDQLQDDWGDTFIAFVNCMSELMWQAHAQTAGYLMPEEEPVDIEEAAQANVDAFGKAVMGLVTRSIAADFVPQLDCDGDQFLDPDGVNADEDMRYMARDLAGAEAKAGRMMSAANHKELGTIVAGMKKTMGDMAAQHKALAAFHTKMAPKTDEGDTSEPGADNSDTTQSGDTSTGKTGNTSTGKGGKALPTGAGRSPNGDTTPLTEDEVSQLIRQRFAALRAGNQRSA